MKFVWTTIQVSDLDRSLAFYHDLLDLPVQERFPAGPNEIAMLGDAEGTKLELIQKPGPKLEAPGAGLSLGFAPADIGAALQKLAEQGVAVPPPVSPNPTMKFYFLQDPDGYVVQLVEYV